MKKIVAIILACLAVCIVVLRGCPREERARQRHALEFRVLATRVLGEELAELYPGANVLVIANPYTQQRGHSDSVYAFEKAGIEGLNKGFGDTAELTVVFPELKEEAKTDPRAVAVPLMAKTPLSYLVAEGAFDAVLKKHPDTGLVVSLIGLPADPSTTGFWTREPPVPIALLLPDLAMIGATDDVLAAFASGRLAAVLLVRPGIWSGVDDGDADYREVFEHNFLLVTPANADETLEHFPDLF